MILRELNGTSCKSYLIADDDTGSAAIVDPVRQNVDRYLALLAYLRLKLEFAIDTHTHADHRSGCSELKFLTGAKIVMQRWAPSPLVDVHLDDGDELPVGNLTLMVLHTPGHTPDGMSVVVAGHVFTGDTLLIRGSGRTDFAGGDAGAQYDSITEKLFSLSDDTIVHPAHDYRGNTQSTIGEEKQLNPRVAGRTRSEYIGVMDNLGLAPPQNIQEVLQPNQSAIENSEINFPEWGNLKAVEEVTAEDLCGRLKSVANLLVLDVRESSEYSGELGHIEGSRLLPLRDLVARISEVCDDKDREIITVCRAGMRSATAAAILGSLGFGTVKNLHGGMLAWTDAGLPAVGADA
jgi:sulfur dioxygenase